MVGAFKTVPGINIKLDISFPLPNWPQGPKTNWTYALSDHFGLLCLKKALFALGFYFLNKIFVIHIQRFYFRPIIGFLSPIRTQNSWSSFAVARDGLK